jgi:DNA mismatch repair protein MutL
MQVADSYILVSAADGYIIIDQHAAHERIQYDRIKKSHGSSGQMSQGLLVPETIELTPKEAALMDSILPRLTEMGIDVEHFGGTSYVIRSKPLFIEKADVREVVMGVLSELMDEGAPSNVDELTDRVYQLMACKSAVKAGQRLHPEAMARLIRQLFECDMPYTCAHGRPTAIKVDVSELEKMFKRK